MKKKGWLLPTLFMGANDQNKRLHAVVARMLEAKGVSAPYFTGAAPFDVERPNSHDTKADFLTEKAATEAAIRQCEDLYDLILSGFGGEGRVDAVAAASICGFVDVNRHCDQQGKRTNSIPEFIVNVRLELKLINQQKSSDVSRESDVPVPIPQKD